MPQGQGSDCSELMAARLAPGLLLDLSAVTSSPIEPADSLQALARLAQRVRDSGVLGRSRRIGGLFEFLVTCALQGRVPKEIEVAIDGFGRTASFDASRDALVRVHMHKLRAKLEAFNAEHPDPQGLRLVIPKGEYRLMVEAPAVAQVVPAGGAPPPRWTTREQLLAGLVLVLLVAVTALGVQRLRLPQPEPAVAQARASALWQPLLQDDLPIQIVLGDYYIFGERDASGQVNRLIRDFRVDSRSDLERLQGAQPAVAGRYEDLALGYLPTSSAWALGQLLPVLAAAGKRTRVTLASELDAESLKTSHVVYIGYLSGLGMLADRVFAGSRFGVGASWDELIEADGEGKHYVSEAGLPHPPAQRYRDYALVSNFPGPNGNQHLVVAGMRDIGLQQAAEILAAPRRLQPLLQQAGSAAAWEALIEVYGMNRTNIEGQVLVVSPLDVQALWREPDAAAPATVP